MWRRSLIASTSALLVLLLDCGHSVPPPPAGVTPVTIGAAGDIACGPANSEYNSGRGTAGACRQKATSDLLKRVSGLDAVLALGDSQYCCGELTAYQQAYHHTWGRFKDITYPVAGNHDYRTDGANGYFQYFGDRAGPDGKGYYSFDLGSWHFVALNSECDEVGGCKQGSPQASWLKADLLAHPAECTLAFWHIPRFSSGPHGNNGSYNDFWRLLYDADADVVLNGHDHIYERFASQNPQAAVDDSQGIRQFTVGTGGGSHYRIVTVQPNSEVRNNNAYGILKLTLRPGSYDWRFISAPPQTFSDSGTEVCH